MSDPLERPALFGGRVLPAGRYQQAFSTLSIACAIAVLLLLCASLARAESSDIAQKFLYVEREAMNTANLPPEVANALDNYYSRSFGGPTNWESIQSLRFDGILSLEHGKARFIAFKKKPNLCKVVVLGGGGQRMIFAYDGADAWQLLNAESDEPVDMPELEALNFIRDAEIGGNLMYSGFPGKQIKQLAGRKVDGATCIVLQVARPDGQVTEHALDSLNFVERQVVAINAVTGDREVTTHSDFQRVAGLSIPFRSVLSIDGQKVQEVQMLRVQVNTGAVSWMFKRSSATYIPSARPLRAADASQDGVDLNFPGADEPVDFVLPGLTDAQRLELLQDLDD